MMDPQKFLTAIQSDNADERFAAWRQAGDVPPTVIAELGKLAGSDNPGVARAAAEALTTMVHAAGKDAGSANRTAIVKGLLALASSGALPARVHALRLLSNIAGEDAVPAIAVHLGSADLREEAIYTLERIPGPASIQAIIAAYPSAPAAFKPRLLNALGHRRAAEAAALVGGEIRSTDPEIALAAVRAYGRIGVKMAAQPPYPPPATITGWRRNDYMDGMLRYADSMAKQGNSADAMAVYKAALASPEEHWQCAAIVGLAKIGDTGAAAAIQPMLKSDRRTVRITAQQAWRRMAG